MAKTPTDFSNLWAWYKADAGVTGTGTNISAWADQSGNSRDLSLANALYKLQITTSAINSLPAIHSYNNGGSNYGAFLSAVNVPSLTNATIYIVGKQTTADKSIASGVTKFAYSNDNFTIQRHDLADADDIFAEANTGYLVNTPAANDTYYTIRLRLTPTDMYLSLNNGTEVTISRSGTPTANPLTLFGTGDKYIAEMAIYTESQSSGNRALVEYYFNQRFAHYSWSGGVPAGWADPAAVITFPSLPTKTVGDADFAPGASSTNTVTAITYASSNTSVATIVSNQIHIVGVGTSTITASQAAGNGYGAATDVTRVLTVNTTTMATLANSVNGVDVLLAISTALDTPVYKDVVCSSGDLGIDSTTEGAATVVTRCGTAKAPGSAAYSVKFEGVHNTTVSSGSEMSGQELFALNQSKDTFLWRLQDDTTPANYYRQSKGFLSAYSETAPVDGYVRFSGTIEVTDTIDLVA